MPYPLILCLAALSLVGCNNQEELHTITEEIGGRFIEDRIYRIEVPQTWSVEKGHPLTDLADTRTPLRAWSIDDPDGSIRITFHSFPVEAEKPRVPPRAQVERWKRQLNHPLSCCTEPTSWSGYCGLYFEGSQKEKTVLGWALQLGREHDYSLSSPSPRSLETKRKEMRSDITFKVTGPTEAVDRHRDEILEAIGSFELIDDLLSR